MLRYLRFFFRATNQYGVHSPFVYGYITRGLYRGKKYGRGIRYRILFRTMAYFKPAGIRITGTIPEALQLALQQHFPDVDINPEGKTDISYYNGELGEDELSGFMKETTFRESDILVVEGIHKNRKSEKGWQKLKEYPGVTVTVDLFYSGVIFFRKGQAREDFVIRP